MKERLIGYSNLGEDVKVWGMSLIERVPAQTPIPSSSLCLSSYSSKVNSRLYEKMLNNFYVFGVHIHQEYIVNDVRRKRVLFYFYVQFGNQLNGKRY
jgi:hypothetical protein